MKLALSPCPLLPMNSDILANEAAILLKKVGLDIASLKNAQPGLARKRSPRPLRLKRRSSNVKGRASA